VTSPYSQLDRPPLHAGALRRAVLVPGGLWSRLDVVPETGSTNADLVAAGRAGGAEGAVLIAEAQTAGKGRLGRTWVSPPRAGIAVSVLLRPDQHGVPVSRYGWLPLMAGVSLVETVRRLGDVDAVLKWPNDMLIEDRKCAGILAEVLPDDGVVIGLGLNVTLRPEELPSTPATSLALAGSACTDRDPLLRALLRGLADWYRRWCEEGGDPDTCGLRDAYRIFCATLGRQVRVALPDGSGLTGTASDVDSDGRLVLTVPDGERVPVAAGDVVHVR
jgi:BirA family biotin operon repressor/biotin-[acetyl-CoA-carboxylase] ligase